jgi:hypothetical protein
MTSYIQSGHTSYSGFEILQLMPDKLTYETLAKEVRDFLIQDECAMSRYLVTDNLNELRLFLDTVEGFIEKEEHREVEALKPYAMGSDFWAENYPYQLRNAIVHNAVMVDSRKAGCLEALVKRAPGIAMSSGFLEIKPEFCLYAYDLVESFFRELHEQKVLKALRNCSESNVSWQASDLRFTESMSLPGEQPE